MKITICGSMTFSKEMVKIANDLEILGNLVVLPRHTKEYAELQTIQEMHNESVNNKINEDLIRNYYEEISRNDAILVVNFERHNIHNYIGGNSFLEIGFAHILNKKIFILNGLPEISYKDEIIAMQPIILNGDLSKIQSSSR